MTVTASASTGYLAATSNISASHAATSAETAPVIRSTNATTGLTAGQISIEIRTASTPAPTSYTCTVYSDSGLTHQVATGTCTATYATFSTGLGAGSTVYITATANSTNTAYVSTTSGSATGTTK